MWKQEAYKHAKNEHPKESCGLIYKVNEEILYGACKNIAEEFASESFVIDPIDWAFFEDKGEILGVVHSHPNGQLKFSSADIASCNYLDVDFYIVDPFFETTIVLRPEKKC
tara:strand:- start:574 stop:906 length:333 start_codon:yes stop_codon:yes gene_type:complete